MFRSLVAVLLLVCTVYYKEPVYAVAAGLFEIAGVIYSVTRPRRLTVKNPEGTEESNIHKGGLY